MSHKPIIITNLSVCHDSKSCFEDFNAQIQTGKQIVIMGSNGAGKSTLLKIIQRLILPSDGRVVIPKEITFGYVPQTVTDYPQLSGGQRFNKALSQALSLNPDVLLLDEPTNHLDLNNKRALTRMLQKYAKTLLVVSHDPEILTLNFDEIWHIEHNQIHIFHGNYAQYLQEHAIKQQAAANQREQLQKERQLLRKAAQKENERAARSKSANRNENDRVLLGAMKEQGARTIGKNAKKLSKNQSAIQQKIANNFMHKVIVPNFNLDTKRLSPDKALISIIDGSCGYKSPIISDINLQVNATSRIAIIGDNGVGKSTIIKALLHDPIVQITGQWFMPPKNQVGYLDQHYSNLNPELTVFETIQKAAPAWNDMEIRKHLNDFLFITQVAVYNVIANLSGGEKARLSLAQIAAHSPYLLLLDEITNNIDLETREHLIKVLIQYPGTIILVSHDPEFVSELEIDSIYEIKNGELTNAKL